jgi:hypothetical protein
VTATCHARKSTSLNDKERQRVSVVSASQLRRRTKLTDLRLLLWTACSFCRESKKKCSGTAPCTQCLRRGLPHECLITYLPRGFRSRNKHGSTGASRQPWSSVSRLPTTSARDATTATLRSPSNAMDSLPDKNTMGTSGLIGPLSPSESRDDDDDTRNYQAVGLTATMRSGNTVAEDTSLTAPGPRMLLSSHGERGMLIFLL